MFTISFEYFLKLLDNTYSIPIMMFFQHFLPQIIIINHIQFSKLILLTSLLFILHIFD